MHGSEPGICADCITLLPLGVGFGGLINMNVVFQLSVRSVVFVLRRNVQLVEPQVCNWFHGYTVLCVMDLLEVLSNGLKQCGATDNTTRASRYDRA